MWRSSSTTRTRGNAFIVSILRIAAVKGLGRSGGGYRAEPLALNVAAASAPAELTILAQLDDTFVLATDGSALVLVDQHAAHERVAFEALAE